MAASTATMPNLQKQYLQIVEKPLKLLSAGVSGHVFVVNDETVVKVALTTGNPYMEDESLQDHSIERKIYERLGKHERICELKYTIDRGLVLERLNQNLRQRLVGFQKCNELPPQEDAFRWSIQAAQGMAYMHSTGVFQGDVGCHNLLLDARDNVKICDFGGSFIDGSKLRCGAGTGFQRPPEDSEMDAVSVQDEVFALGSTIYEIWTTRKPYQNDSQWEGGYYSVVLDHFKNRRFPDLAHITPADIIRKCWLAHYTTAAEVVTDLDSLQIDELALASTLHLAHERCAALSSATFAIIAVALVLHRNI